MGHTNQLTIVHVVRQFHPGVGGMENFVEQLAIHQVAAGHRVKVVTLDRIFDDQANRKLAAADVYRGINVVRLPYWGANRYPLAPAILSSVHEAQLIHVHGVDFFCDFLAATTWIHRKPMVLTTHGGFFHTSFARTLKRVYFNTVTRVALSQFGAVIACSDEDERTFRGVAGSRLTLIPNPVDIAKFESLASPDSATIIYFGRIAPNKELERLIDWFAGLASSGPQWRLIIAGKPMGVSTDDLRNRAKAGALADRVEIHDLPTDDELKILIGRSSIYCCASSYEGFGLAAIEAASAGLYPVLSDIPPFQRSIERLGFGTLVKFEDSTGWPESYAKLGPSLAGFRRSFPSELIKEAVAPFAWSAAIPRFDAVYRRLLGLEKRRIGPVNVDVLDQAAATGTILDAAAAGRPLLVTFCNAHTANLAHNSADLRQALAQALVLNDGIGVDIASRLLFGSRFPENLNGTDFVPMLIATAGAPLRLFLIGGAEGVAESAAKRLAASNRHVTIAGTRDGFFDDRRGGNMAQTIRDSGANLVLVAMGQPKQELWAAAYFRDFAGPTICVGALFDFLAGNVPRAPALVRRLRFEWAFRLLTEPRRLWRRYLLGNGAFMMRVIRQKVVGGRI